MRRRRPGQRRSRYSLYRLGALISFSLVLFFQLGFLALAAPPRLYPDKTLTPGVIDPEATTEKVCKPGYTKTVRNVPESVKREVFSRYQVKDEPGKYEVDHFVSLELGGSNDVKNLWPEPYSPKPGAHEKDWVEDDLHRRVCRGQIKLSLAQELIRRDWYAYWKESHR